MIDFSTCSVDELAQKIREDHNVVRKFLKFQDQERVRGLIFGLLSQERSKDFRLPVRIVAMESERLWRLKKEGKKGGTTVWKYFLLDNTQNYLDSRGDKLFIEEPGDRDVKE